jgi:hypothetical protein
VPKVVTESTKVVESKEPVTMSEMSHDEPRAHVYAPRFPHDPIEIIGNRRGLERLINALIDAITLDRGTGFVQSCEGQTSELRVTRLEGKRRPEEWRQSGSPYWDVDDPLMARILDLTEENTRLRKIITTLRCERKSVVNVDYSGDSASSAGGMLPEP